MILALVLTSQRLSATDRQKTDLRQAARCGNLTKPAKPAGERKSTAALTPPLGHDLGSKLVRL